MASGGGRDVHSADVPVQGLSSVRGALIHPRTLVRSWGLIHPRTLIRSWGLIHPRTRLTAAQAGHVGHGA